MSMRCVMAGTLAALALAMPALELDGAPSWLDARQRVEWRDVTLGTALGELEKLAERPLTRSPQVTEAAGRQKVFLVEADKTGLRSLVEALERSHDLRFTCANLRWSVETVAEHRERRRRPVAIDLRDYALFIQAQDHVLPELGMTGLPEPGAVTHLFQAATPVGPLDIWKLITGDLLDETPPGEALGRLHFRALATPEEEVRLRQRLERVRDLVTRRMSWAVSFGTLPADAPVPNGLVEDAAAAALVARLGARQDLALQGLQRQRIVAATRQERNYLQGQDVVSYEMDPRIGEIVSGRQATLCAIRNHDLTTLDFALQWVEPAPDQHTVMEDPARTTIQAGGEDGKGEVIRSHGSRMRLTKPTVWQWRPAGACFLAPGQALVLVAEHAAGRAVAVVREVP